MKRLIILLPVIFYLQALPYFLDFLDRRPMLGVQLDGSRKVWFGVGSIGVQRLRMSSLTFLGQHRKIELVESVAAAMKSLDVVGLSLESGRAVDDGAAVADRESEMSSCRICPESSKDSLFRRAQPQSCNGRIGASGDVEAIAEDSHIPLLDRFSILLKLELNVAL